jgi:8-oxo-dGTP diphosphatase
VGVIIDSRANRVLLTRRPAHLRHGGLWEFPGGKQEPGESADQALRRELFEELNLVVVTARPGLLVSHDYPDQHVELRVWLVTEWHGDVHGREGQEHEWVRIADLHTRDFPGANLPIIRALQLPRLYVITPDLDAYGQEFFEVARRLLSSGVSLMQFRSRRLEPASRPHVICRLAALCGEYGAALLINGTWEEALNAGAGGLHLPAVRHMEIPDRPIPASMLLGVSCHDAAELGHAERMGADFAVLGPVSSTRSHPGRAPLGWPEFARIIGQWRRVPVFAVGGVGAGDLSAARDAGAWGAAVISGLWSAGDPAAAVDAYLRGISRAFSR